MLHVYINSPQPRFTIHHNPACSEIQKNRTEGQRFILINNDSLRDEIRNFHHREYRFAAKSHLNDMWLRIDLGDEMREEAVALEIKELIGRFYSRVETSITTNHC